MLALKEKRSEKEEQCPKGSLGPDKPRATVPREQAPSHQMLSVGAEEPWIGRKGNKKVLEGDSIPGQRPHPPEVVASLWVPNSWLLCSLEMLVWFDSGALFPHLH